MTNRQATVLTIHIGLPKTGTTTLQRQAFPLIEGYLGGTESLGGSNKLPAGMLHLYQSKRSLQDWGSIDWADTARSWWASAQQWPQAELLLSLEGLYRWPDPETGHPWPLMGKGRESNSSRMGTHPIVEFLDRLSGIFDNCQIRVLVTLRNQADFLASLYAQLSYRMSTPNQRDFDHKVKELLARRDPFLDWGGLTQGLSQVIGQQNLKVCFFEDGLPAMLRDMAEFVAPRFSQPLEVERFNQRATRDGGWSVTTTPFASSRGFINQVWPPSRMPRSRRLLLRPVGGLLGRFAGQQNFDRNRIILEPEIRSTIRETYRQSTDYLSEILERDLRELGY